MEVLRHRKVSRFRVPPATPLFCMAQYPGAPLHSETKVCAFVSQNQQMLRTTLGFSRRLTVRVTFESGFLRLATSVP